MSKRLQVALIGAGKMGRHHIEAINEFERASIVAIADQDTEALSEVGQKVPGVRLFEDAAEMLSEAKPDVVHIVTQQPRQVWEVLLLVQGILTLLKGLPERSECCVIALNGLLSQDINYEIVLQKSAVLEIFEGSLSAHRLEE